jgi:hypothetical protein
MLKLRMARAEVTTPHLIPVQYDEGQEQTGPEVAVLQHSGR